MAKKTVAQNQAELVAYSGFSLDQLLAFAQKDGKAFAELLLQMKMDQMKGIQKAQRKIILPIVGAMVGYGIISAAAAANYGNENLENNNTENMAGNTAQDHFSQAAQDALQNIARDKAKSIWNNIAGSFSFGKDTDKSRIPIILAISFGILIAFRTLIFSSRKKRR